MRSTGKDTKRVQLFLTLSFAVVLASCARPKQSTLSAEDMSVLENSTFSPGEKVYVTASDEAMAPTASEADTVENRSALDGGFIGLPGGTSAPDGGVIAKPGTGTPVASPNPSVTPAPVVVVPPAPTSIPVVSQPTSTTTNPSGTTSTPSSTTTTSTGSPSTSSSPTQPAGSDAGYIGQNITQSSDTGNVSQTGNTSSVASSTTSGSSSGSSPTGMTTPDSGTGSGSSSTSSNSSSTSVASNTGSSSSSSVPSSPSSPTQPSGNDGGYIGQNAGSGSDTGNINPGISTIVPSTGGTSGSTPIAGTTSGSGTGTSSSGTSSSSVDTNSTSIASNTGTSSSGSSSSSSPTQPSGNDGGYIGQNTSPSSDTGSVNQGSGTVVPSTGGTTNQNDTSVVVASNSGSSTSGSSSNSSSGSTPSGNNSAPSGNTSGTPSSSTPSSPTQPSGNDGGTIGQTGNQNPDGGSVISNNVGSATGTTAGSSGTNISPAPIPTVNAGGNTIVDIIKQVIDNVIQGGNNSAPSGSASSTSSTSNSSSPTQPSGNDSGTIGQTGNQNPDGGSVISNNVGSATGTTAGSSGTNISPAPIPTVNAGGNTIVDIIKQIIDKAIQVVTNWITGSNPDQGQIAQNGNTGVAHGNNGVGNGLDPQPPGNPPVNDGAGTSPGNPGNANNGNTNNHNSGSCGCTIKPAVKPPIYDSSIEVNVGRACSDQRSKVKAPRFVFFEESKRPILSIEAMSQNIYAQCQNTMDLIAHLHYDIQGTYCGSNAPKTALVTSQILANTDLIDAKTKLKAEFSKAALKKQLGSLSGNQVIAVTVCDDTNNNGKCSDEKPSNILSVLPPSFAAKSIPTKLQINVWSGRNLSQGENPENCDVQYSPLLLDLTGAGFKLSGPQNGVYFDLNNTGTQVTTGWTDAGNMGFLVRDLNKDGGISSGAELFGNATKLQNGETAENGFEALKDLDNDKDLLFTYHDKAWRTVKIWVDKNQNGIAERKELYTLDDLKIESINLNYKTVFEVDQFGNQTKQRSVFNRTIRAETNIFQIIDVWFQTLATH